MTPRALAVALALSCAGCVAESERPTTTGVDAGLHAARSVAPARTWHFVLDPSVGVDDEVVIRRALLSWERQIPCDVDFVVERRRVSRLDQMLPPPFVAEIQMGVPPAGVGWTDWDPSNRFGARIVFLPNATERDARDFPRVVEHELGHVFHLAHTREGLMANPAIAGVRVGPSEGAAFATKWCPAT